MDITCLKFLNIRQPYFFRKHHDLLAVGNLLKAPKGSELMGRAYEVAVVQVTEENRDWHKPIKILNDQITVLKLEEYIDGSITNRDWWTDIQQFLERPKAVPKEWLALHWMNEEWRTRQIPKNNYQRFSTYHDLLVKFRLAPPLSFMEKLVMGLKKGMNAISG